jgi:hypothetical protein
VLCAVLRSAARGHGAGTAWGARDSAHREPLQVRYLWRPLLAEPKSPARGPGVLARVRGGGRRRL